MRQMIKDPSGLSFEAETKIVETGQSEYRVWNIYSGSERCYKWRDRARLEAVGYSIP
jgi:hypothetical protein